MRYHHHCGAAWPKSHGPEMVLVHREAAQQVSAYVSNSFTGAANVASADVLFAVEAHACTGVELETLPLAATCAAMVCAAGRHGRGEAQQIFVPWRVLRGSGVIPYRGHLLAYSTYSAEAEAKHCTEFVENS